MTEIKIEHQEQSRDQGVLLRGADVNGHLMDVALKKGVIASVARSIDPLSYGTVIHAGGGALLPGLHDHHIHLNATAAAVNSVLCGPPDVSDAKTLAAALHGASGDCWLRGIGYHDSVAGPLDRTWLDRFGPARPVRVQHRSGRLWILNRLALAEIGIDANHDGRFIDQDDWLRDRLPILMPDLAPVGRQLAAFGVTGMTEVTPRNVMADYRRYALANLPQRLLIMGRPDLDDAQPTALARRGAVKLHYHDHDLPALDVLTGEVARAHAAGRNVAAHCVTPAELMLTLAAMEEAGPMLGDRIEHGAIIGPETLEWIVRLGATVVSQPHFLSERAATYRRDVDAADLPYLYRLSQLKKAGVPIAAGSDAPFGGLDPWASMAAAVNRPAGFGPEEELTPEEALGLYTSTADAPGIGMREVAVGEPADLCLLDRPWVSARGNLAKVNVRMTFVGGQIVYSAF